MADKTLHIDHTELKRCDLFVLTGRIDGATAPEFEAALRRALDNGRFKLVLNMAGIEYMSSAALRILINTSKECRRYNRGDVRLAEISQRVAQVLELAGLTELFQIYANDAEAVGSF